MLYSSLMDPGRSFASVKRAFPLLYACQHVKTHIRLMEAPIIPEKGYQWSMKDHTLRDTYGLQTWVLTHLDFVSGNATDALFLETIWLLESESNFVKRRRQTECQARYHGKRLWNQSAIQVSNSRVGKTGLSRNILLADFKQPALEIRK